MQSYQCCSSAKGRHWYSSWVCLTLCFDPSVDHGTLNRPLCDNRKHLATILSWRVQRQSQPLIPVSVPCPPLSKSSCLSNRTLNQIRKLTWLSTSETCQWWDWAVGRSSEIATKWFVASDHKLSLSSSCFVLALLTCHTYVHQNENLEFLTTQLSIYFRVLVTAIQ